MKRALQTVSQESSRPDSDLACNPPCIRLPRPSEHPTHVQQGQTVRWRGEYKFSVNFTSGVFDRMSINAVPEPDGYGTPPLPVIGPSGNVTICTYVTDADNPQPTPPPNVIIVDNSGADNGAKRKGAINVVRGH
jgi:hypothetical protein